MRLAQPRKVEHGAKERWGRELSQREQDSWGIFWKPETEYKVRLWGGEKMKLRRRVHRDGPRKRKDERRIGVGCGKGQKW